MAWKENLSHWNWGHYLLTEDILLTEDDQLGSSPEVQHCDTWLCKNLALGKRKIPHVWSFCPGEPPLGLFHWGWRPGWGFLFLKELLAQWVTFKFNGSKPSGVILAQWGDSSSVPEMGKVVWIKYPPTSTLCPFIELNSNLSMFMGLGAPGLLHFPRLAGTSWSQRMQQKDS